MTPQDARDFADGLQERVTQMGDRTGEGQYLGQCLSVIRGLAAQVETLTPKAHGVLLPNVEIVAPAPVSVAPDAHLGAEEDDGRGPEARVAAGE